MFLKIQFVIIIITFQIIEFYCLGSDYGEICEFSDECLDHRMICTKVNGNKSKCFCDRYHKWFGPKLGCIQIYNATTLIKMTVTTNDNSGKLEKEQEKIFRGAVVASFFILAVGFSCILSVITFCCYIRRKDKQLAMLIDDIKKEESAFLIKQLKPKEVKVNAPNVTEIV